MSLAETITILIETKTIADNTLLTRAKFARNENDRCSQSVLAVVDIVVLLPANRVPGSLPISRAGRKSKEAEIEEGRSRARFTRMYPAWHVVAVEASLTTRNSRVTMEIRYIYICMYIPFYPGIYTHIIPSRSLLFTTRYPHRKGTWKSAVYLHEDTQARTYVRVHTHPQSSL